MVELSAQPVRYHIACVFDSVPDKQCHSLAMSCCRIACHTTDVIRGRLSADKLHRAVSTDCLKRLETMACLLDAHFMSHPKDKARLHYLPAVPHWMVGMLVSPTCLEMTVQLSIGPEPFLVNLRLEQIGSAWKCTLADMG